jgi:hypothetical protein
VNTTQFLLEVSDLLDNANGRIYPEVEIVRHGDRQLRGMYRTLVESNKQYSNYMMGVQAEAALEPADNVFDYRLPLWVMAVTRVWIRGGSPTSESTFNMYAWTSGAATLGLQVPKSAQDGQPRWAWQGSNTLRLLGFGEAQELVLEVVVRPAPMFKGLVATENPSTSAFYLPTPTYGTVDLEEGAYVNSDWQVTGTAALNATQFGLVRRCVYSNAATIVTSVRYHELTLDAAFPVVLAQGDTIETVLALPDEHTRLLVLLTARACFQKKGNMKGLEATQGEMLIEQQRFVQFATPPRDSAGPTEWKRAPNSAVRSGFWGYGRYYGGS